MISNKDQNVFILLSIKEFVLKKKSVKSVLVTFSIFGFSFVYVSDCKSWPNVAPFDNRICYAFNSNLGEGNSLIVTRKSAYHHHC